MILVIYGEERILMEQKLAELKKQYQCNEELMNISTYRANEDAMEDVYEDLITLPFLTDNKMVVLRNPYFLTTKKEKKEEQAVEWFLKCLKAANEKSIFVIFHDIKNFDERKKIVKQLRKEAKFFQIDKVNHYKVSDAIRKAVKKREATISDDALELLLQRIGDNLTLAALEVEKLCLYTKDIHIEDVDGLVNKPLEENVFQLTSAIMNKERQKIFSMYKDLMVLNEEPVKLIVLIANQMRLLYQVRILDRKGYTDKEIAKMIAVNPYRLKYIRNEGRDFDMTELLECLDALSHLDIQIKTGQVDKKMGLELFLLGI